MTYELPCETKAIARVVNATRIANRVTTSSRLGGFAAATGIIPWAMFSELFSLAPGRISRSRSMAGIDPKQTLPASVRTRIYRE